MTYLRPTHNPQSATPRPRQRPRSGKTPSPARRGQDHPSLCPSPHPLVPVPSRRTLAEPSRTKPNPPALHLARGSHSHFHSHSPFPFPSLPRCTRPPFPLQPTESNPKSNPKATRKAATKKGRTEQKQKQEQVEENSVIGYARAGGCGGDSLFQALAGWLVGGAGWEEMDGEVGGWGGERIESSCGDRSIDRRMTLICLAVCREAVFQLSAGELGFRGRGARQEERRSRCGAAGD